MTKPSEGGWTTTSPEHQRRQFWANFTTELAESRRRHTGNAERQRLDRLETYVLVWHHALWQFHKQRIAVSEGRIAFETHLPADDHATAVTPLQQFNRAAAVLAVVFSQWDDEFTSADYDLLAVHTSSVSFAGHFARCYALLWREVAGCHLFRPEGLLIRHRPQMTVSIPECERGLFYHRELRRELPGGGAEIGGSAEDCTTDDLEAVNNATGEIPELRFESGAHPEESIFDVSDGPTPFQRQQLPTADQGENGIECDGVDDFTFVAGRIREALATANTRGLFRITNLYFREAIAAGKFAGARYAEFRDIIVDRLNPDKIVPLRTMWGIDWLCEHGESVGIKFPKLEKIPDSRFTTSFPAKAMLIPYFQAVADLFESFGVQDSLGAQGSRANCLAQLLRHALRERDCIVAAIDIWIATPNKVPEDLPKILGSMQQGEGNAEFDRLRRIVITTGMRLSLGTAIEAELEELRNSRTRLISVVSDMINVDGPQGLFTVDECWRLNQSISLLRDRIEAYDPTEVTSSTRRNSVSDIVLELPATAESRRQDADRVRLRIADAVRRVRICVGDVQKVIQERFQSVPLRTGSERHQIAVGALSSAAQVLSVVLLDLPLTPKNDGTLGESVLTWHGLTVPDDHVDNYIAAVSWLREAARELLILTRENESSNLMSVPEDLIRGLESAKQLLAFSDQPELKSVTCPADLEPTSAEEMLRWDIAKELGPKLGPLPPSGEHEKAMTRFLKPFNKSPNHREVWARYNQLRKVNDVDLPQWEERAKKAGLSLQDFVDKLALPLMQRFIAQHGIPVPEELPDSSPATTSSAQKVSQATDAELEERAIGMFVKSPDLTVAEIAKKLGVNRSSPYRWPRFLQTFKALNSVNVGRVRRGSKDRETGEITAPDED